MFNVNLMDKVVAVTGGAGGIGIGITQALREAGAKVAMLDLNGESATRAAAQFDSDEVIGLAADVTDEASIGAALAEVEARFKGFNCLVNNAGIVFLKPASELTAEESHKEIGVNTIGTLICANSAAAIFRRNGTGGTIVNIASNAGKVGYPNMAIYNASKAAVINLTRSLSMEWAGDRINVNAVCPGGVATDMLMKVAEFLVEGTDKPAAEMMGEMFPVQLGRHVEPIEVGRIVAFLLSEHAIIIRGQALTIDGGDTPY